MDQAVLFSLSYSKPHEGHKFPLPLKYGAFALLGCANILQDSAEYAVSPNRFSKEKLVFAPLAFLLSTTAFRSLFLESSSPSEWDGKYQGASLASSLKAKDSIQLNLKDG